MMELQILLVEDDPQTGQSFAALLRQCGHQVELVADAPAALALARVNPPDVAILDIDLPGGMDGYQLAKRLRLEQRDAAKRSLLIALTGHGEMEDRRRSEQAGIDLHLVKPADPEQIQALLGRFQAVVM